MTNESVNPIIYSRICHGDDLDATAFKRWVICRWDNAHDHIHVWFTIKDAVFPRIQHHHGPSWAPYISQDKHPPQSFHIPWKQFCTIPLTVGIGLSCGTSNVIDCRVPHDNECWLTSGHWSPWWVCANRVVPDLLHFGAKLILDNLKPGHLEGRAPFKPEESDVGIDRVAWCSHRRISPGIANGLMQFNDSSIISVFIAASPSGVSVGHFPSQFLRQQYMAPSVMHSNSRGCTLLFGDA